MFCVYCLWSRCGELCRGVCHRPRQIPIFPGASLYRPPHTVTCSDGSTPAMSLLLDGVRIARCLASRDHTRVFVVKRAARGTLRCRAKRRTPTSRNRGCPCRNVACRSGDVLLERRTEGPWKDQPLRNWRLWPARNWSNHATPKAEVTR